MSLKTLTYTTYQSAPTGDPNASWTTVISDVYTGAVQAMKYTASETEGRTWAEGYINGVPNPHGGWMANPEALKDLDKATAMQSSDYDPPPKEARPEIEATCYICGTKFKPAHTWSWYTDDLTLTMQHCGKTEHKHLTLKEAHEVAKVGWLAFMG